MRRLVGSLVTLSLVPLSIVALAGTAGAWSEATHQNLTRDALSSVQWLDQYKRVKVTPFKQMVADVLGSAAPVSSQAFDFKDAKTRQAKRDKYLGQTAGLEGASKAFAQHLLLSDQFKLDFALGENKGKRLSAKQVLAGYSGEPDWGMDKGLDASRRQGLMGGTDAKQTSSQGFRHLSFLFGKLGQGPQRAQLFFDLGAKAIEKGHAYWGFRFVAWGLHYLEDMGTPVHTNILPTSKYIRLKGMFRPKGADDKRHFNKGVLRDLVQGSGQINANYHFLYEHYVDQMYTGKGRKALGKAVRGDGKEPSFLARLFAPKTVTKVAGRRGWSRLSTPGIARNAIRYFTDIFRKPAAGAAENTVRSVDERIVEHAVATGDRRAPQESKRAFGRRLRSRDAMMRSTTRQFRKNGIALRQAITILGRQVGKLPRR